VATLCLLLGSGATACNRGGGDDDGAADAGDTEGTETNGVDTEGDDETGDTDDDPFDVEIDPVPGGMRRLLGSEYVDSIELMLGTAAAEAALPAPDQARRHFVAIGAQELSLAAEAVEQYERSARFVADATVEDKTVLAQTAPCVLEGSGQACYEEVATELGRFAFRRSLTGQEVSELVDIALDGQAWGEGDFDAGLKYMLMALLQAPSFLYIQEVGEPDDGTGYRRLTSTEMAARLSFFLHGRTPSLELIDLGENGGLATTTQIRAVAEEMVESPRARAGLQKFTDELFHLKGLEDLNKQPEFFPLYSSDLGRFMREETRLFIIDLVWDEDGDARRLLDANYTFLNDPLAELYGIAPPGTGEVFARTSWPAEQGRRGVLSQASFLARQSNPNRNSPIKRGLFVQEQLLCTTVPPPPADIDAELPDDIPEDTSLREMLEIHDQPECGSCHSLVDPIGFGFEFFDAIGQYRTLDNGVPIDASGSVEGLGTWQDAAGLASVLADDPRTMNCFVRNMIRGQLGHMDTPGQAPGVDDLVAEFSGNAYSIKTLLVEMAVSPIFRLVDEPK
jgi:hypothetical protein